MEPEGSLLHYSQVSATCPYPEPVWSSPSPTPHCLKIHLNFILTSKPPSGFYPSGFPTKILYTPHLSPTGATCSAHLILLDFITQIIFGEEYRLSSSLSSFLHYPVTSSFLGPNILLNSLFSNSLSLHSSFTYMSTPPTYLHGIHMENFKYACMAQRYLEHRHKITYKWNFVFFFCLFVCCCCCSFSWDSDIIFSLKLSSQTQTYRINSRKNDTKWSTCE